MTTTVAGPAAPARSRWSWPTVLWAVGAVLLVSMVVHVIAIPLTGDTGLGPVSLRKPATFSETGWLLAWSAALILPATGLRPWQRHVVGGAVALFGVVETAVIGVQAWRGVPSHYNFSTPLDAALIRIGAAGTAGVFLIGMIVLLVGTLRSRGLAGEVRLGIVGGVMVTLVGAAAGFVMISNNSGVYQGAAGRGFAAARSTAAYLGPDAATVGPDYAGFRPATLGGDLVLPHAIGVHGLVLLAVPALLAARSALPPARRRLLVTTAVSAVLLALAILVGHALRALPLDTLPVPVLALLALCAVAYAGAAALSVAAFLRRPGRHDGAFLTPAVSDASSLTSADSIAASSTTGARR